MASFGIRALGHYVDDVAEQLDIAVEVVARKLTIDAWGKLVKKTPVDTGRARASWAVTVSEPYAGPPLPTGTYPPPTSPPAIEDIDGTTAVFITSNLAYMERLEDGHSGQAPQGMVRITLAEVAAELDEILAELDN